MWPGAPSSAGDGTGVPAMGRPPSGFGDPPPAGGVGEAEEGREKLSLTFAISHARPLQTGFGSQSLLLIRAWLHCNHHMAVRAFQRWFGPRLDGRLCWESFNANVHGAAARRRRAAVDPGCQDPGKQTACGTGRPGSDAGATVWIVGVTDRRSGGGSGYHSFGPARRKITSS
jgi:hypothetical protein